MLFLDSPCPAACPGGSTQVELSSRFCDVGSGSVSKFCDDSGCVEATADKEVVTATDGGVISSFAGEMELSAPAEGMKGGEHNAPSNELCMGDRTLSDGPSVPLGAVSLDETGAGTCPRQPEHEVEEGSRLRRAAGVLALPLSPDAVVPQNFDLIELGEKQQDDAELAQYFARVGSIEKVGGKEEFIVLYYVKCYSVAGADATERT